METTSTATLPNREQMEALAAYRREHGRNWKSKLISEWESGTSGPLRQIRNQFGPSWLMNFRVRCTCNVGVPQYHSGDCAILIFE